MESKWIKEKENLEKLIFEENLSYEEIGRRYNCSGGNIRKVAKLIGIELPVRGKNAGQIPHNKGTAKKYYCLNCGSELNRDNKNTHKHKYCSNKCLQEYEYKQWVIRYKSDSTIGITGKKWKGMSAYLRRYIFEKFNNKCCLCGWSEINPYTHTIPLEIDHIDGNANNNKENNLRLICPNCHSLTENYRGANKGNGRNITWVPTEVLEELKSNKE